MMQFAGKEDMAEVSRLWQESFGDGEREIADFFAAFAGEARICVWRENGRIAGQLVLLPVFLHDGNGGSMPAEYIYAVATGAAFRRRGICTRLLGEVSRLLGAEGKAAVLVPADKKLAAFYEERGFKPCFAEEKLCFAAGDLQAAGQRDESASVWPERITVRRYLSLRRKAFAGIARVEQPDHMLSYALGAACREGCRLAGLTLGGREYGVLYREAEGADGGIFIREITAGETEEAVLAARALMQALGAGRALLQRSFYTLGICLPADIPENGYFNLVMD